MPPFSHLLRVSYADCTIGDHVYYSRYLDFLEAARGEFFRHIGAPLLLLQAEETIFPVLECHLRYKSPARYDDLLRIDVQPVFAKGARLNFNYRIFKTSDALVLEAETLHVCTSLHEKPRRLPPKLEALLQPWLATTAATHP